MGDWYDRFLRQRDALRGGGGGGGGPDRPPPSSGSYSGAWPKGGAGTGKGSVDYVCGRGGSQTVSRPGDGSRTGSRPGSVDYLCGPGAAELQVPYSPRIAP